MSSSGRERLGPRATVVMQKVQALSQPSWVLIKARVPGVQAGQRLAGQRLEIEKILRQAQQIGCQTVFLLVGNDFAHPADFGCLTRFEGSPAAGDDHLVRHPGAWPCGWRHVNPHLPAR